MVARPNPAFEHPFNEDRQGTVTAAGELDINFKNTSRLVWIVEQVTLEMPTAPSGSVAEIRWQGVLVAPAFSAKKAAIGGDPPIVVRPGETISANWTGCTTGDVGRALFVYRKTDY